MGAALDAMPDKALVAKDLITPEGDVCALGAVAVTRKVSVEKIDPEDYLSVAGTFGISHAMAREIMYENDEGGRRDETPQAALGKNARMGSQEPCHRRGHVLAVDVGRFGLCSFKPKGSDWRLSGMEIGARRRRSFVSGRWFVFYLATDAPMERSANLCGQEKSW